MAEFTVGTAGIMVGHLDSLERIKGKNLWWGGHGVPGAWDVEGGAFSLGACLKWWRDNMGRREVKAGPGLLECKMVRFFGHFEGDAQTYRAKGEIEEIRANNDCIKIFRQQVGGAGVISDAEFNAIDDEVLTLIEDAASEAKSLPEPSEDALLSDVYVAY